jgi:TRAP-type mannitol/chloroaromatic compound transport system permease large subunit
VAVFALAMLALGLVAMMITGWASYAVLLGVACIIAAVGVASGSIDAALLGALPLRIISLLEHDLLQAVALYAFVGALLREIGLADSIFAAFSAAFHPLRLAPPARSALAGFAVGALAAPMNGSVGAGTAMLAHAITPRWRAAGLADAPATALTAVTATLGVIVPPSLVLLLLGDAMLRAHTEALTLSATSGTRIINTQDVVQACAPVALLLALAWAATAAWCSRRAMARDTTAPRLPWAGVIAPLAVIALLALVASGRVRAVEAAATAGVATLAYAASSGRLAQGRWARVLDHAMSLSGALFALLLAATTLSLVLRAAGCDALVAAALARCAGRPQLALALVLGGLLLMAFVLDAFELVFLVVPLVMPPLLVQVPDAGWVACLTLLTLQAGFLLPPWGYAVLLARSLAGSRASAAELARALLPYLVALATVFAVVLTWPAITHWLRSAPLTLDTTMPAADVDELLRQMTPQRDETTRP